MMNLANKGAIRPDRALVKPRVFSPEIGDILPLEDIFLNFLSSCGKAEVSFEIVGNVGSGKTVALAHLAAIVPPDRGVVFLDDPDIAAVTEAAGRAVVVYAVSQPLSVPGKASYRLAPWSNDELTEYLLAAHPAQCRSVMARLQAAKDRHLPEGMPELWQAVLERMAEDDDSISVAQSLRQILLNGLPKAKFWTKLEEYCLEIQTRQNNQAAKILQKLQPKVSERILRILRHRPVQLILASELLAKLLETETGRNRLEFQLPCDLVKLTAKKLSPLAIANLSEWAKRKPEASQAMAASLLHADDCAWIPNPLYLPVLSGAYLDDASWRKINLAGAKMNEADFNGSDLSNAILDGASAMEANFSFCLLNRASLINIQANGADFESAELILANARGAMLFNANFPEADLTGAFLQKTFLHGANLTNAQFENAQLIEANLLEAKIDGANFSSANLQGAFLSLLPLRKANFSGANFSHAHLSGCDMEYMVLPKANFAGVLLNNALLTGTKMRGANFINANLSGACMADIDWEGADLRGADLRHCTFQLGSSRSGRVDSPIACEGSKTGFYEDEFEQQTYRPPEEIRKANLYGANLRHAAVEGADFYLVDLRKAQYLPSQLEHFRRCGAILFDRE